MDPVLPKRRRLAGSPGKFDPFGKPLCYSKFRELEDRINSYKNWPIPEIQTPEELAKAGFFYEGKEDLVRCFTCGGAHCSWRKCEDPSFEHAKYFPTCSFTIAEKGRDFVTKVKQTIKEKYCTVEARLSSYNEYWPSTVPKTTEELAAAGFFHTGNFDETQCFECGIAIKNWKADDVAWLKHAKRKPSCKFVSDTKGSEYIAKVKQTALPDDKPFNDDVTENRRNLDIPIHGEYTTVEKRLASFKEWPIPEIKQPKELAEIGFFYAGREDYVSCFHCDGEHFNWQVTEDPSEEHAKWYPACSFIRRIKGAKFVEGVRKKVRKVYWTEEARKESFKDWPEKANKTPEELYKAGFFSTKNDDQVQCFDCGFWYIDWEIYDDPWFIHAKLNPRCKFLTQMRGEIFVNQVEKMSSSVSGTKIIFRNRKKSSNSDESSDTDDEEVRILMKSSTVQTALKVGFDECRIFRALRSHIKNHKELKNVEELFAVIMDSQKQDPEISVCLQNLEKDNEWLKEKKVCKICEKQGPIMLYVPCGHLHSCCFCVGLSLQMCIGCEKKVEHKLELFPQKNN